MNQTPIEIPVKRRKRRVLITSRKLAKLENAKRRLQEVTNEVLFDEPTAVKAVFPDNTLKACADLIAEYFSAHAYLSPASVKERSRCLDVLSRFMGPRPLSRDLIEQFVQQLHLSDHSDSYKHSIGANVSLFLNWLYASERIAKDWRKGIKFPKAVPQKPREIYTEAEYRTLLAEAGDRPIGWIVMLGWNTGFSLTDCCNLTWASVDLQKCVITKPRQKTKVMATNPFPFGGELHMGLKRQHAETLHVYGSVSPNFPVCKQAYQNTQGMATLYRRLFDSTGLKWRSFHSMRSTLLSALANSSAPMAVSLPIAGLKRMNQLLAYVGPDTNKMREALANLERG